MSRVDNKQLFWHGSLSLCRFERDLCPAHTVKMLQDITALPGVECSEYLIVFLTILFRFIHSF